MATIARMCLAFRGAFACPVALWRGLGGCFRYSRRRPAHLEKKADPTLEERRKQSGSGRGTRSQKSGQSIYFEGYKKHTLSALLCVHGQWRPVPLVSSVRPANVSEQSVIAPLLRFAVACLRWPLMFVVTDQGYINAHRAQRWRRQWRIGQVVHPKSNMKPPSGCDSQGCPLCPMEERLIWVDYDPSDEQLLYRGNPTVCATCPLAGACPKRFEYPAQQSEIFWGMVPFHSRLAQHLLHKFRPRIEPQFNLTKNKYDVTDFFINSRHLAQTLCIASDVLETLEILAQERPRRGRETRNALLGDIIQLEFWD